MATVTPSSSGSLEIEFGVGDAEVMTANSGMKFCLQQSSSHRGFDHSSDVLSLIVGTEKWGQCRFSVRVENITLPPFYCSPLERLVRLRAIAGDGFVLG